MGPRKLSPFCALMVTDDRMKYTPQAVSDYLDLNDDGKENEGGNNKASNSLWIKDLELTHGSNKYVPFMNHLVEWS